MQERDGEKCSACQCAEGRAILTVLPNANFHLTARFTLFVCISYDLLCPHLYLRLHCTRP